MIDNIDNGMSNPPMRIKQNLTEEQSLLISNTLSEFDVENLNDVDAKNIVEIFSQAGIQPGQALEKAVSSLGFDAKEIGELANTARKGERPPPPPQQSSEEITSMVEYLTELLEEKLAANKGDNLSEEDKQSILKQTLQKFNIEDADSIINTSA